MRTNGRISTRELAKRLGMSRSSLYYRPIRPALDEEVRRQIEGVMVKHPAYGHKRIAATLKLGKNRVLRVMKKFGMKPARRRVSDFTYIRYKTIFIFVATIMDMHTREIVGWHVARFHNVQLVIGALNDALGNPAYDPPAYLHSDRGSEYEATDYEAIMTASGITQLEGDCLCMMVPNWCTKRYLIC